MIRKVRVHITILIDDSRGFRLDDPDRWVAGYITDDNMIIYDTQFTQAGELSYRPVITNIDPNNKQRKKYTFHS
jgi:hypothetical protein